jgi:hypothetical protein
MLSLPKVVLGCQTPSKTIIYISNTSLNGHLSGEHLESQKTFFDIPPPSEVTMIKIFAHAGNNVDASSNMAESLQLRFRRLPKSVVITGLRAYVLYLLSGEQWPVAQWKEDQKECTRVFKIHPSPTVPCGSLTVYGVGSTWQPDGKRFTDSTFEWIVANIRDIRDMLPAAQKILGLLYVSRYSKNEATFETDGKEGYDSCLFVLLTGVSKGLICPRKCRTFSNSKISSQDLMTLNHHWKI